MVHYLFVVTTLGGGGAERVVSVLASELAKTERVTILAYYKVTEEYERSPNVNVVYMTTDVQRYNHMNYFIRLTNIRRLIKEADPDYVIPFLSQVCMQVTVALYGSRYKVIQTVRNDPATLPASKVVRILRDLFIRFSYKTIVQNQAQKEYFDKRIWSKVYVMPNPVRTDLFEISRNTDSNGNNQIQLVAVGRLSPQKNYEMLIQAMKASHELREKCRIKIYGEGPSRDSLTKMITDANLDNCVQLMGRTNDMMKVYSSADIFVMTSKYEGMPNALMEAMASELPCISTDCPTGPSELIKPKKNGMLIGMDDIEELINCIIFLLNNKETAKYYAQNARREMLENYTPKTIVDKFKNICSD